MIILALVLSEFKQNLLNYMQCTSNTPAMYTTYDVTAYVFLFFHHITAIFIISGTAFFLGMKSKFENSRVPEPWVSYLGHFSSYRHNYRWFGIVLYRVTWICTHLKKIEVFFWDRHFWTRCWFGVGVCRFWFISDLLVLLLFIL